VIAINLTLFTHYVNAKFRIQAETSALRDKRDQNDLMVPAVNGHLACCKHHNDMAICLENRHR
jgi:hypothetical protein